MSSPASIGQRLGPDFAYRWTDKEPTPTSWADKANRRGCAYGAFATAVIALIGFIFGGAGGFFIALVMFGGFGLVLGWFANIGERLDDERIPRSVAREAYIEQRGGEYYFILTVDGQVHINQPWSRVLHFERNDYWPMYGDGGRSPYKVDWHAIVMDPLDGVPWCIASTMEGMADVREKRAVLEAKFGADARAGFMRKVEAQRRTTNTGAPQTEGPTPPAGTTGGVPKKL